MGNHSHYETLDTIIVRKMNNQIMLAMLAQGTGASFPSPRDIGYTQLIFGFCGLTALGIIGSDVRYLGYGATMAQISHPSTNTIARVSIFGAVILLAAMLWLVAAISRSSYVTQVGVVREQPVPFSQSIM
jgi:hypothetical protein